MSQPLRRSYILHKAAEKDIRDIIRYTCDQWGSEQAQLYAQKLDAGINQLASLQGRFKDMSHLYSGLKVTKCEHHFIFGLSRTGAPMLILAVFHERMDMMTRLAHRLE